MLIRCYRQHADLINLLADIDKGTFTITMSDYQNIPGTLIDALNMFKQVKAEYEAKRRERLPNVGR